MAASLERRDCATIPFWHPWRGVGDLRRYFDVALDVMKGTTMRTTALVWIGLLSSSLHVSAQLTLHSGQSWTHLLETGELLFRGELPFTGIQTYSVSIDFHPGSFQPGSQLLYEIVRGGSYASGGDSFAITPVASAIVSNVPPDTVSLSCSYFAWYQPEGPGGVRLTMLFGTATVNSMKLEARTPYVGQPRHDDLYSVVFVPRPGPRLALQALVGSRVRLSWSTNEIGYHVESAFSLSMSDWMVLNNPPTMSGTEYVVDIEQNPTQRYFRLRRP